MTSGHLLRIRFDIQADETALRARLCNLKPGSLIMRGIAAGVDPDALEKAHNEGDDAAIIGLIVKSHSQVRTRAHREFRASTESATRTESSSFLITRPTVPHATPPDTIEAL